MKKVNKGDPKITKTARKIFKTAKKITKSSLKLLKNGQTDSKGYGLTSNLFYLTICLNGHNAS